METLQKKLLISPENLTNKSLIRSFLLKKRREIHNFRREEASHNLLSLDFSSFDQVFSFESFKYEIDTSLLNKKISSENHLFLPQIDNETLNFYDSHRLKGEVTANTLIIVPGLGFDALHYRIGYGKGYYDRFLSKIPKVHTWGIGFKEQWVEQLPIEEHDIPLFSLYLF